MVGISNEPPLTCSLSNLQFYMFFDVLVCMAHFFFHLPHLLRCSISSLPVAVVHFRPLGGSLWYPIRDDLLLKIKNIASLFSENV